MSYTAPFTAVTGATINASDWNTSGRDDITYFYNLLHKAISEAGGSISLLQNSDAAGQGIKAWNNAAANYAEMYYSGTTAFWGNSSGSRYFSLDSSGNMSLPAALAIVGALTGATSINSTTIGGCPIPLSTASVAAATHNMSHQGPITWSVGVTSGTWIVWGGIWVGGSSTSNSALITTTITSGSLGSVAEQNVGGNSSGPMQMFLCDTVSGSTLTMSASASADIGTNPNANFTGSLFGLRVA